MSWLLWLLPLADSGPSSGIDPGTFWVIMSAMGGAISTLASVLYKSERDRRIAAEAKLDKFNEIAPDLAENVQWLVEEAQDRSDGQLPWPYQRQPPRRVARRTTRRR